MSTLDQWREWLHARATLFADFYIGSNPDDRDLLAEILADAGAIPPPGPEPEIEPMKLWQVAREARWLRKPLSLRRLFAVMAPTREEAIAKARAAAPPLDAVWIDETWTADGDGGDVLPYV